MHDALKTDISLFILLLVLDIGSLVLKNLKISQAPCVCVGGGTGVTLI